MIYKFRSKAAADLIMLGADGDRLLRLIGREPAPQGIIEPAAMAAALQAIEAAVAADVGPAPGDEPEGADQRVRLRQRVWPMVEMLRRSLAEQQAIVWGV